MKAYTLAELAVSLTIVFTLLLVSIFSFQSFAPSSALKSDKESISSKLTQASILARNPVESGFEVTLGVTDKQLTIFRRDSEGNETKNDDNPLYIKSDSIAISPKIVFESDSGKIEYATEIELKKGRARLSLHVNEMGIISE